MLRQFFKDFISLIFVLVLLAVLCFEGMAEEEEPKPVFSVAKPVIAERLVQIELPKIKIEKKIEKKEPIGFFDITAYCSCNECCGKSDGITATGTKATQGRTIAVDPEVIPYGTKIVIAGNEYIAEDCGGAIKGNMIDIYFDNHADALEYGVRTEEVYLVD